DIHGRDRAEAVARPQVDRLGAILRGLLRTAAIVKRPGADGADRNLAAEPDGDRVIHRRQIVLLHVIARAGLADAPGEIDTEPVHGIACPAAPVALQFERLFRLEDAAVPCRVGMEQEIALLAKQPEAVADFPGNLNVGSTL